MNIPEQEVYISGAKKDGNDLELRLITDYHPGAEPAAYSVIISNPDNGAELISFAENCTLNSIYLYIYQKDNKLVFEVENGEYIETGFNAIRSCRRSLDAAEFKSVMERTYSWYLSENERARLLHLRIHEALHLLIETNRRILIKSEAHEKGGTASKLYLQQAALISRVIKVLET